jgi:hypothetical protein
MSTYDEGSCPGESLNLTVLLDIIDKRRVIDAEEPPASPYWVGWNDALTQVFKDAVERNIASVEARDGRN